VDTYVPHGLHAGDFVDLQVSHCVSSTMPPSWWKGRCGVFGVPSDTQLLLSLPVSLGISSGAEEKSTRESSLVTSTTTDSENGEDDDGMSNDGLKVAPSFHKDALSMCSIHPVRRRFRVGTTHREIADRLGVEMCSSGGGEEEKKQRQHSVTNRVEFQKPVNLKPTKFLWLTNKEWVDFFTTRAYVAAENDKQMVTTSSQQCVVEHKRWACLSSTTTINDTNSATDYDKCVGECTVVFPHPRQICSLPISWVHSDGTPWCTHGRDHELIFEIHRCE